MDSGTWFGIINLVLLLIATFGYMPKFSKWITFFKEWLDVVMVALKAVADGKIDSEEADAILKEWEEAKAGGQLPSEMPTAVRFVERRA
jgi:hypothetical protein